MSTQMSPHALFDSLLDLAFAEPENFNEGCHEFWLAQTNHAPTKELLQIALWQYDGMSGPGDDEQNPWSPQDYLEREADDFMGCDRGYDEDGELWPSWCTLVATPAINAAIDWPLIDRAVNGRWHYWIKTGAWD